MEKLWQKSSRHPRKLLQPSLFHTSKCKNFWETRLDLHWYPWLRSPISYWLCRISILAGSGSDWHLRHSNYSFVFLIIAITRSGASKNGHWSHLRNATGHVLQRLKPLSTLEMWLSCKQICGSTQLRFWKKVDHCPYQLPMNTQLKRNSFKANVVTE